MSTATEYAFQSATVDEAATSSTDPGSQYLRLSGTTSARLRALLDVEHGVPMGEGASVVSATLYFYKAAAWSAGATVTLEPLSAAWDAATTTWTNQPGVRATSASVVVATAGAAGDQVSVDITSLVNAAVSTEDALASRWYGLRLSITATGERLIYSAFASEQSYRPRLEIEWNVPPDPPTDLLPSDGLAVSETKPQLFATFFDDDAEDAINGVHVQIDDASTFATPVYDSGMLAHTEPSFDLNSPPTGAPATPTLSTATTYYWRMKVRDSHNASSDWSDTATFVVTAKGTLTLTAPASFVTPIPVITHTLTSVTQESVEILIERKEDGVWQEHYFLPRYVTTATSHQVPDAYALEEGYDYRLTLKVWDTVSRDDLPGDREFYSATLTGAF